MSQNGTPGQASSLHCDCGFYTSSADYMLLHLRETDCRADENQNAIILNKLKKLAREGHALRNHAQSVANEEKALYAILTMPPTARKVVIRYCNMCKKATKDFFGEVPQCRKHVAKGDEKISSILEDFLYGK